MTDGYSPAKKGTILIPSGSADHLHFICSDPIFFPDLARDCVLVVNISTVKPDIYYDPTCILNVGDHSFIRHPSFVFYKKADVFGADNISRNVADGTFTVHEPCDNAVFTRIMAGFNVSEDVKLKVKRFYIKYCLTQL